MSYCINPNCLKPQNSGNSLFCFGCGSELLLQGYYRVTRLLSNPHKPSGFGTIYEVNDNGTLKVLKVLHNNHPKAVELFRQEAEVLQRLNHPGIPKVEKDGYFLYQLRNSSPLHCLVMEKIEGMNLEEWLQARNNEPIVERAAISCLKQLVEILHAVHQQQYFHRDIKPPNIMLRPNGQLALIDFGTAREVSQTFMQKLAGQQVTGIVSAGYTPSEQINGKAVPQSDFFSLGRTFVYLLTGKHPNSFGEDPHTGELIWRNNTTQISPALADLIDYLMKPFPGNRPQNTQEISQRLHDIEQNLHSSASRTTIVKNTVVTPPKPSPGKSKIPLLAGGVILILAGGGLYYGFSRSLETANISSTSQPETDIPSQPSQRVPTQATQTFTNGPLVTSTNQPVVPINPVPTPVNPANVCTYVVADTQDPTLNVRTGPGTNNKIITQLENGRRLSVVKEANGWLQINSPVEGWVAGNRTKTICNR